MKRMSWLASFEVGERRYVETTVDNYRHDMSNVAPKRSIRGPAKFSVQAFSAVSVSKVGDVRLLLCIERIE